MSQPDRMLKLLSDGLPKRTDEILRVVYGNEHLGLARVGAVIFVLKKRGHEIVGWTDENVRSLYWYQMTSKPPAKTEMVSQPTTTSPAQPAQGVLFDFKNTQHGVMT